MLESACDKFPGPRPRVSLALCPGTCAWKSCSRDVRVRNVLTRWGARAHESHGRRARLPHEGRVPKSNGPGVLAAGTNGPQRPGQRGQESYAPRGRWKRLEACLVEDVLPGAGAADDGRVDLTSFRRCLSHPFCCAMASQESRAGGARAV